MRVLQINSFFSVGGPPRIVKGIYDTVIEQGHECVLAASREKPIEGMEIIKIGTPINNYWHLFKSRIFDAQGFSSTHATKILIKKIEEYKPDVIHLHNLHGYYLNIEILFDYLKQTNYPVIWTLHDCWAFTGHCAHFDYIGCNKWHSGCYRCSQKKEYPRCDAVDGSKRNYSRKKTAFLGIKNLTIVTPSKWLAGLIEKSFLRGYPVKVIHNGIDLEVFKPTKGNFRNDHKIQDKFIVLGVAQNWDGRKGLNTFIELSKILESNYQIVLVGLSSKHIEKLPKLIIGIGKTNSTKELIEIYSDADVFVNPTLEDNFPTVNLESLACGTPVITYNTGGSVESIDETCGSIVEKGNLEEMYNAIKEMEKRKIPPVDCIKRAEKYRMDERYQEYLEIYKNILSLNEDNI